MIKWILLLNNVSFFVKNVVIPGINMDLHGFDEIPGMEEDLLAFEAHMPTHAYEQLVDGFNDALEHKLDHPHDDSHRNISKNKQGGVIRRRRFF